MHGGQRAGERSPAVVAAPTAQSAQNDPQPQMCALSEPRRSFVSERPQTLLPLAGLPLRLLPAGGGAAARHGRAGGAEAAAGGGGEESARPGQWWRVRGGSC